MEILGIGPLELAFIAIIILLVLGPKEMVSALRTLGRVLRSIVTSSWWQTTRQAIQDVRKLPYDLMREAGMEEDIKALDEIRQTAAGKTKSPSSTTPKKSEPDYSAWTEPAPDQAAGQEAAADSAPAEPEPRILPPSSPAASSTGEEPTRQPTTRSESDNDQET